MRKKSIVFFVQAVLELILLSSCTILHDSAEDYVEINELDCILLLNIDQLIQKTLVKQHDNMSTARK